MVKRRGLAVALSVLAIVTLVVLICSVLWPGDEVLVRGWSMRIAQRTVPTTPLLCDSLTP